MLIGRDIKVGRENPVRRRGSELHIGLFHDFGAVLTQTQDELIECLVSGSRDLNPCETLVDALLADFDLVDFETAARAEDLIEHLRQNERIDDVTTQLDRL